MREKLKEKIILGSLRRRYPEVYAELVKEADRLISTLSVEEIKSLLWYSSYVSSEELYEVIRIPSAIRDVTKKYIKHYFLMNILVLLLIVVFVFVITKLLNIRW